MLLKIISFEPAVTRSLILMSHSKLTQINKSKNKLNLFQSNIHHSKRKRYRYTWITPII